MRRFYTFTLALYGNKYDITVELYKGKEHKPDEFDWKIDHVKENGEEYKGNIWPLFNPIENYMSINHNKILETLNTQ